jgi:hypothetical protein
MSIPKAAPKTRDELIAELAQRIKLPRERSEAARERRYQAERDLLVAVLSRIWPSHITSAARMKLHFSEVVCIHSPVGQLAWGLPPERTHLFDHLERSHCDWDGHGPSERAARLRQLLKTPLASAAVEPAKATSRRQGAARRRRRKV